MNTKAYNAIIRHSLNQLIGAKQSLRQLDVLRSERTTGEIGEWFVAELYGGTRAPTTTQPDWDVETDKIKIQVKAHAKSAENSARWTNVKADLQNFDELIIVAFTEDLFLEEFYKIPINDARKVVEKSGQSHIIKWYDVRQFKIPTNSLPRQDDLVRFFIRK